MISQANPRTNPPSHDPASWTMLDRLARGVVSPLGNLRDAIDLTLEQVADWVADAKNRRRINNLLMLLNVQAQLLLSEHRLLAAERLMDVINDPKAAPETVRRACSDLLRTNLVDLIELRRGQKWEGEEESQKSEVGGQRSEGGGQRSEIVGRPSDGGRLAPTPCPLPPEGEGKPAAPQRHAGKDKAPIAAHREFKAAMLTHGLAPPASGSGGGPSLPGGMFIANHGDGGTLNGGAFTIDKLTSQKVNRKGVAHG